MTKISEITGVSINLSDDDLLEKERADGVSEQFSAIQMKNYIFSAGVIVPTGSDQSDALVLEDYDNVADVVAPGSGVKLKSLAKPYRVRVRNTSANDLNVYPKETSRIDALAVDAPFVLASGNVFEFIIYADGNARAY